MMPQGLIVECLSQKQKCVLLLVMPGDRKTVTKLEFPYTRTLGPTIGAFAAGLREKRLLASRTHEGKVLFPPLEYDPETGVSVGSDLVEVGPTGTVQSWTWVPRPTSRQPLANPFAFALIKLDGADTAVVHVLAASSPEEIRTGMRVVPRWRETRSGRIDDIEAWEEVTV
jgi:uncharacterized OB-fold protein